MSNASLDPKTARSLSPVETSRMPDDQSAADSPSPGTIALCLSGGGYRAMIFHLGALLRLNEAGYLPKIDRISSVSGGSITAATLGLYWRNLRFDANGSAANLREEVVDRVRALARETVDAEAIIKGALFPGSISDRVVKAYRKHLFGNATLQDLPDQPRFVINATNVQSRSLFRFSKPYIRDWRVGEIPRPTVELAVAVAASSAFPPFLSPCKLELDESDWTPGSGGELDLPEYKKEVVLTDGGVYDNLGLETAWKNAETVLVSDGGGTTPPDPDPDTDWARHSKRVLDLVDFQVRSLRKRHLIGSYIRGERKGTYWGIRSDIADYQLTDAMPAPFDVTLQLAATPTRLAEMEDELQERLINWGYAVCDAGLRRHVDAGLSKPAGFPYARGI